MTAVSNQERDEQYIAQIAGLSCETALNAIKKGISAYIINSRKRPKTKYEYNQERVRDFRVGKIGPGDVVPATVDEVADDLEQHGKASYFLLQTDPVPFVRNYKYDVIKETISMLHPKHPHFKSIVRVDISNQLIGDERFNDLCDVLNRSFIKVLNISGNKLSNAAMKSFSAMQRSMHHLEELNVSRNKITDEGIQSLCSDDTYSTSLQKLDATFNALGPYSALHLGTMFRDERRCALHSLRLGGRLGRKGWGDEFIRVLISAVVEFGLRKLRSLSIPDAGLSSEGLDCVSAALVCDEVVLEELNVSKNGFERRVSRQDFLNALRLNRTLKEVFIRECGFTEIESKHALSVVRANRGSSVINAAFAEYNVRQQQGGSLLSYKVSWADLVSMAHCAAGSWSACRLSHHRARIAFIKDNPWRIPGPPLWQVVKGSQFDSDMLSNVATIFTGTQVVLPTAVRAALEAINQDLKYADLLKEALLIGRTLSMDPRTVKVAGTGAAARSNAAAVAVVVDEMERDVQVTEQRQESYERMCRAAQAVLFKELQLFGTDSEAVLRVAKRRERKNIQVIIAEVSQRMNSDRLLFAVEDYRGCVTEECEAVELLVGCLHRQKLLYYALLQENASRSTTVNNTSQKLQQQQQQQQQQGFDLRAFMRKALPYYGNLETAAAFVHYFYIAFPVERADTKKIEERMLQHIRGSTLAVLPGPGASTGDRSNSVDTAEEEGTVARKSSKSKGKGKDETTNGADRRRSKRSNVFIQTKRNSSVAVAVTVASAVAPQNSAADRGIPASSSSLPTSLQPHVESTVASARSHAAPLLVHEFDYAAVLRPSQLLAGAVSGSADSEEEEDESENEDSATSSGAGFTGAGMTGLQQGSVSTSAAEPLTAETAGSSSSRDTSLSSSVVRPSRESRKNIIPRRTVTTTSDTTRNTGVGVGTEGESFLPDVVVPPSTKRTSFAANFLPKL